MTRIPSRSHPVELVARLLEVELLRGGVGGALGNDDAPFPAVEVDALDGPVVEVRHAYVGPVDVPGLGAHRDAVRDLVEAGQDDALVRSIGVRGHDAASADVQLEEAAPGHVALCHTWRG